VIVNDFDHTANATPRSLPCKI